MKKKIHIHTYISQHNEYIGTVFYIINLENINIVETEHTR